ncbi:MAG: methionyl-tRNA formyltransferase [Coxiellaceae bacterium]|jgi:methionyl-tRNA formyltransferase|nr:methionyl-tRNA formyltransferase [Coxiellaceae bacterium]
MNIILFGSSDITLSIANFLYTNKYNLVAIVTVSQIFDISYNSNGVNNVRFVDLKIWGLNNNVPVFLYENVESTIDFLRNFTLDFAIVAGWYHMIPSNLRNLFSKGCVGFHASLLPQLRGGAPLNWAILLGLPETGVSFFEFGNGVDDGLLYAQKKIPILPNDYIGDLVEKSKMAILDILKITLPKIKKNQIKKYKQIGNSSYCGQRFPEDSLINWRDSAFNILALIRASSKPYHGAFSFLNDEKIVIWKAEISKFQLHGIPGQIIVVDGNVCTICGEKSLIIKPDITQVDLLIRSNHKRFKNSHYSS